MNKRTKACNISTKVRNTVHERDGHSCIFCGSNYDIQICHLIPRSKGGLGIPENLFDGCIHCHMLMDQTVKRKEMIQRAEEYLRSLYVNFDEVDKIYRKGATNA